MPYELELPARWVARRWKVKIYDREGPEEPHVSLLGRSNAWRISLRTFAFLDREPPSRQVPRALVDFVRAHARELQAAWDALHPANPVSTKEDDDA